MIGIIDYGAGNTASVINALKDIGAEFILSARTSDLQNCEKIIFPGVGEASTAMQKLKTTELDIFLNNCAKPILGICLGMQLLFESSEEGATKGLGIIKGEVVKYNSEVVKVPHMGWSRVDITTSDNLFDGIDSSSYLYFANSYYAPLTNLTIAKSFYLNEFTSAVRKDNYLGVQFHPEKSGNNGLKILENFVRLC